MTAPALDSERLARVLQLELDRGCDNGSVVGGLDRMFITMVEDTDLARDHPFLASLRELPPGGYRSLGPEERRAWLRGTIGGLRSPRPGTATTPPRSAPRPATPAKRVAAPAAALEPGSPVEMVPGVTRSVAAKLEKLGITTAGGLASHVPRRFNDFSQMRKIRDLRPEPGQQSIAGEIISCKQIQFGRRMRGTEALVTDGTGTLRCIWFNATYVVRALSAGDHVVMAGRVRLFRGRLQMESPEFEPLDAELMHTGRMVPVYPATYGLGQKTLRRIVKAAVDAVAGQILDPIPAWVRREQALPPFADALTTYHYPASDGEAEEARRRLALGEFVAIQAAVLRRRVEWQQLTGAPHLGLGPWRPKIEASLPFALTDAQKRVTDEILEDLARPQPMLRLLQGDVGSGKTVVALEAMLAAVVAGHQAALMAPTEILAEQHYRSLSMMLGGEPESALDGIVVPKWLARPIRLVLITGSLTAKQKAQLREDAAHGGADIVIGTHALLESGVQLPRLGLAVIDEQHRFGVLQRAKLRQKGNNPHLLVMTATPIPRTLALTVYGDLDVSTLDEMPPGRLPVRTTLVAPEERADAYTFIRERLDAGEQAFVICPLVEESEVLDARSAEEEYERLRAGPLRLYRLDLLHGRMVGRQKDEVMGRFAGGQADVLVSTSVVEVGVNVPNATVMVIEGAERFGLSQLHQFRGRVGRSAMQSYCLLFTTAEEIGPEATQRLEAMAEYTDGFKLAEVNLEIRGEGEAWGRLQSGSNTMLHVARISDRDLLYQARAIAREVLDRDPDLEAPEHAALRAAVEPILTRATEAN